jgi:multidrug resistance efflux pump
LLFVIDPRPYKAQLDAAQANLAQAKAALDLAKIQFARDEEVIGERASLLASRLANSGGPDASLGASSGFGA